MTNAFKLRAAEAEVGRWIPGQSELVSETPSQRKHEITGWEHLSALTKGRYLGRLVNPHSQVGQPLYGYVTGYG